MSGIDRRDFLVQSAGALSALALLPSVGMAFPTFRGAATSIGVIGVGDQGRSALAELAKIEQANVVAICDTDDGRLKAGLRRVRGVQGYATHQEMLEKHPEISAVIIATPTHTHRAIAEDAVRAGKHVYCEAPLAYTIEDCQAIVEAARGSEKVFQAGLQGRSNPIYKLARTFFVTDSVRDLVSLYGQCNQKSSWRQPAPTPEQEKARNWRLDPALSHGLAGELGPHQFDVFHWYTGRYPVRVFGTGGIRFWEDGRPAEMPDTIALTMMFEDGSTLQYGATLANSFGGKHEVLFGSNAAIKLSWGHGWMFKEHDAPTQGWEVYANRQRFYDDEGITLIADATQLASQGKLKEGVGLPNSSLYYALADFIKSVTEGTPVACSADEGLRATVVGIKADEAVRGGGLVEIDSALLR